jgi:hypothetical protein
MKMEEIFSSETSVHLQGLHGVISHKIQLFTTTAVRTSNIKKKLVVYSIKNSFKQFSTAALGM